MQPFKYTGATNINAATNGLVANPASRLLAGGTNLVDLMKEYVERPNELIDINNLKLKTIALVPSGTYAGSLSFGGLANNTDTANHPLVRQRFPLLTQAILAGASQQIRNMATNGGNLNQRTRCPYFYEVSMPCNKREPGTGCGAKEGFNRLHAVFGWSDACVAVHPSDMCIALAALDAVVHVQNAQGTTRTILFTDYHRLPGDTPERDNNLNRDEIITGITLPKNNFAARSYYLKIRDRASYAFALVSVAAALEISGTTLKQVRIALGGVAHKPWRATKAEEFLVGKAPTEANFLQAAALEMRQAKPLEHNAFKVPMGTQAIARALLLAYKGGVKEART